MEHPKDIGDRTTLAVMLALRDLGLGVLVPFGENTRYDLVIDDGTSLSKVQCKTGRLRNGAVRWSVCSNYGHHRESQESPSVTITARSTSLASTAPRRKGSTWFPIAELPVRRQGTLRVEPAKNCQRKFIRPASEYEIGRVKVHAPDPDSD